MNFNNSKLTHFLSFVCVFESKVPCHALLEATKVLLVKTLRKWVVWSWSALISSAYFLFFTFLFICRGGWGGKPQCFIFYLLTDLKKFWQLSCFITIYELLLRGKLFFKSLILTGPTTISIVHFYCYSVVPFFNVSLT